MIKPYFIVLYSDEYKENDIYLNLYDYDTRDNLNIINYIYFDKINKVSLNNELLDTNNGIIKNKKYFIEKIFSNLDNNNLSDRLKKTLDNKLPFNRIDIKSHE